MKALNALKATLKDDYKGHDNTDIVCPRLASVNTLATAAAHAGAVGTLNQCRQVLKNYFASSRCRDGLPIRADDLLPIVAIGTSELTTAVTPLWFDAQDTAKMLDLDEKCLSKLCRTGKIECRDDSDPSKLRRAYKIHIDTINNFNGIPKR